MRTPASQQRRTPRIVAAMAVAALAVMASCEGGDQDLPRTADTRLRAPGPPGDVADLPVTGAFEALQFLEQDVVLPGNVEAVLAPGIFVLDGDLIAGDGIVVVAEPAGLIAEGAQLRVVGTVRTVAELPAGDLPEGVGTGDLEAVDAAEVIVASSVRSLAEVQQETDMPGDTTTTAPTMATSTTNAGS